ncbi:DUF2017 domain-containing protein [Microlunatus speluncae]|uniref:DUF2017 domain-containing protein n=1 Tax=Microlunatus speluncae TaxID=2594267 RepID=UPI0013761B5A|nr:DUF2017 domain-containing protein [Microlunatus speluncae]
MQRFKRKGGVIVTSLSADEVELLTSLVGQLVEMVSGGQPEQFGRPEPSPAGETDPFVQWARELEQPDDTPEVPDDPALQRLFPTAYPADAEAAADFRRFTERDLRATKVTEATTVLRRLAETEQGRNQLRIPADESDAWLRTLTGVRLAVAARLGITDAAAAEELAAIAPHDPRAFMASVYEWLGFAQETLIMALER